MKWCTESKKKRYINQTFSKDFKIAILGLIPESLEGNSQKYFFLNFTNTNQSHPSG